MSNRKISNEEIKTIIKLHKNGMTANEIASEIKRHPTTIERKLKELNLIKTKVKYVTDEEVKLYIIDYNNGMLPKEIGRKYHRGDGTVISHLRKAGIYKNTTHRYTEEEINSIKEDYQNGDWDSIFRKIPDVSKQSIATVMSRCGIRMISYFWSEEEMDYLKDHYLVDSLDDLYAHYNGRYTKDAIQTKALKKFGYSTNDDWTEDEEKILVDNYSYIELSKLMELLPNRTKNAIICHARKFNLYGYFRLSQLWKEDEIKFVADNWENMTDEEMSKYINHTIGAIKCKRNELGLYRQNRGFKAYESLNKYLRGQLQKWKVQSMEQCNYQCVLTGSKDFQIHHLYPVNRIIEDIFTKYELVQKEKYEEYTQEEIDEILDKFIYEQSLHPLGVCVETSLHTLFHNKYGKYNISEIQWNEFADNYKNGVYDNEINKVN